ncbi:non-homologous end-joining DNA ligase (plasmid) [Agrobacterium leguminum]|uniref:non-homologous end-joining DNA ligase n=1 Tax=Agrobacterium leguminum TaxID=2792015 RepID=UPI0010C9392F|nr:non-homologous end-joining DNA ligase [Agrobacterium leguminum]WFS69565.1 non-homologous end-joining DNA ligase [Agrobacterium leguminum]
MAKVSSRKPPETTAPDPMPTRVEPCVATLAAKPPKGPDWGLEIKWDGYRVALHIKAEHIRIITRGGYNWTDRFPAIAAEASQLGLQSAILDGEAVVLDEQGRSDFGMLQRALGRRPAAHVTGQIILFVFDLLYLDGRDLRRLRQGERRRILEAILTGRTGAIRLSEEMDADGDAFLRVACAHGLEGIVAKHRGKAYRSGRRPDWLKIKCVRSDSFVIVGFEPSAVSGAIGRLLLAAKKGDGLVYVGGVGTGFTVRLSQELRKLLDGIKTKAPAVDLKWKNAIFTEPLFVAEIEYRAWTDKGKLRHASFKGIRERADDATVYSLGE